MKEEKLVKKWLEGELTDEEMKALKKLDAYSSYAKISEKAKYFKSPRFTESDSLRTIETSIESRQKQNRQNKFKVIAAVAAILIVVFSAIRLLNVDSDIKTFETGIAKIETFHLPDHSEVNLSSKSSISFHTSSWKSKRNLKLEGEAFFKVKSGKTFTVETSYGKVQVLGTQFNVKARDYSFEVTCFEGSVSVNINDELFILKEKETLTFTNGNVVQNQTIFSTPDWTRNSTLLKSISLDLVLKEFQNYYDVEFDTSSINTSRLYTGSFTHNDINIALKSITLPLELTYQIENKKVILSNK